MGKSETIRIGELEKIGQALDALPKKPPEALKKEEALRMLARKIAVARAKGHDLAAIVAVFAEGGIAVSENLLKTSLRPKKKAKPKAAAISGSKAAEKKPVATTKRAT